MITAEVIKIFREQIAQAKASGLTDVSLENLSNLVDVIELEAGKTPVDVEQAQARLEEFKSALTNWQNENQRDHESNLEMLRATIATSHLAIKSALLINGGAAVAFLAFLGSAWSSFPSAGIRGLLAQSLRCFVIGVFLTGLGSGVAYLCQACLGGEFGPRLVKVAEWARWLAILLVLGSFFAFYRGSNSAIQAFLAR